jgi:hypothetical protein
MMTISPDFRELVQSSVHRALDDLAQDMPRSAASVLAWISDLSGTREPADYFLHPVAFPFLLLPWWLEHQIRGANDHAFQSDLIRSNVYGYYYTRLIDNVMDGHATVEDRLLPASGYFVSRFRGAYQPYFDWAHPFWAFFHRTWSEFGDVTTADGQLLDVDRDTFEGLVAHKVCAAKISLAAVCHRNRRPEDVPQWSAWIDVFGAWHLFREDLFDWQQDLQLGTLTYFLCEARRRKGAAEAEVSWIAREGLEWAMGELARWMAQVRELRFVPPEVMAYLDDREREVQARRLALRPTLAFIQKLTPGEIHER